MKKLIMIAVIVTSTALVAGCGFSNCGYSTCTSCCNYVETTSCCGSGGWY